MTEPLATDTPTPNEAVDFNTGDPPTLAMEKAVACLAVELPAEVWEDVRDKWHAARDALAQSYTFKVQDLARETRRTSAALTACNDKGRMVGMEGIGWDAALDHVRERIEGTD